MRASVLSACLAFGVAQASIGWPATTETAVKPVASETSICDDDLSTVVPTSTPSWPKPTAWTTSTVLSTSTYTVTKCPATVKHCPAESVVVSTAIITVGTTVCPVTEDWPVPTWTTAKPDVPAAPPVWVHPTGAVPAAPPAWSSGTLPAKPAPTKAVPVTAGAGRAAVPVLGAVAGLVAYLL